MIILSRNAVIKYVFFVYAEPLPLDDRLGLFANIHTKTVLLGRYKEAHAHNILGNIAAAMANDKSTFQMPEDD